ncbi:hypothetical protein EKN06_11855 [Croceicoccus ponticola]|uniref:Uncharacterized protein n=1 Tax=Croceicoccus ponticola TaxID=2217664 RepID=A0A437GVW5_9SPHN|nr:hypothetical protein [Croceicoccus ponticola]RVQ66033.1 hypothetical protein EKN06_11855 [Croceicoccus ponticola]
MAKTIGRLQIAIIKKGRAMPIRPTGSASGAMALQSNGCGQASARLVSARPSLFVPGQETAQFISVDWPLDCYAIIFRQILDTTNRPQHGL